ncbi:MAG: type II toxin-antitoxin system VapC family toxin [Planctomycetaceae bacterium]|nr:type II toxin-antitoxin system VapC family toxin [Planctomycetaceae bacterium]
MIFADLVSGSIVFLDANTFVYHFAADSSYGTTCRGLLDRVERQDVRGVTSTHIVTEVAHRLMAIEAITQFGWPLAGIAYRLRKNASEIQKLALFKTSVETILNSKVNVLTIAAPLNLAAAEVSRRWGLLSSDAMAIAVMQAAGITNLASNDSDFDRVTGIIRYAPT